LSESELVLSDRRKGEMDLIKIYQHNNFKKMSKKAIKSRR